MIVRNELRTIRRAVKSVLPHVDSVLIHDTGSSDGTWGELVDMAEEYPKVRVEAKPAVPWCTVEEDGFEHLDFGATRNRIADASEADWLFILDGDEVANIPKGTHLGEMCQFAEEHNSDGVQVAVYITGETSRRGSVIQQIRLYKRLPSIRWRFPIHNRLEGIKGVVDQEVVTIKATYLGGSEVRLKRSEKPLLKLLDEGDERVLFYLGNLYSVNKMDEEAFPYVMRALGSKCEDITVPMRHSLAGVAIGTLLRLKRAGDAEKLLYKLLVAFPGHHDLHEYRVAFSMAAWARVLEKFGPLPGTTEVLPGIAKHINRFIRATDIPVYAIHEAKMEEGKRGSERQDEGGAGEAGGPSGEGSDSGGSPEDVGGVHLG